MSGYDCTGPVAACGPLLSDHDAALAAEDRAGKPIALMGGGTTRVGDPSGKDESAQAADRRADRGQQGEHQRVFSRFLSFGDGPTDAIMVDNAEWLTKLNYIEFLRDVGRHFSVNRMLSLDQRASCGSSASSELSFLEFNYMILQAYDFVELNRRYGCILQMGGSDQWGNIVNGIDLGRRMGTPQLYALTCPLLTTASGAKMGKTAAGAVWLNADMLAAYDYWQFWRNTEDADVGRFLKLFTAAADGRDRPARSARRRRDQRGQEGAGDRGDRAPPWPRGRRAGRRNRAQDLRAGQPGGEPADRRGRRSVARCGLGVLTAFGPDTRGSCPRPARRAGR